MRVSVVLHGIYAGFGRYTRHICGFRSFYTAYLRFSVVLYGVYAGFGRSTRYTCGSRWCCTACMRISVVLHGSIVAPDGHLHSGFRLFYTVLVVLHGFGRSWFRSFCTVSVVSPGVCCVPGFIPTFWGFLKRHAVTEGGISHKSDFLGFPTKPTFGGLSQNAVTGRGMRTEGMRTDTCGRRAGSPARLSTSTPARASAHSLYYSQAYS